MKYACGISAIRAAMVRSAKGSLGSSGSVGVRGRRLLARGGATSQCGSEQRGD